MIFEIGALIPLRVHVPKNYILWVQSTPAGSTLRPTYILLGIGYIDPYLLVGLGPCNNNVGSSPLASALDDSGLQSFWAWSLKIRVGRNTNIIPYGFSTAQSKQIYIYI